MSEGGHNRARGRSRGRARGGPSSASLAAAAQMQEMKQQQEQPRPPQLQKPRPPQLQKPRPPQPQLGRASKLSAPASRHPQSGDAPVQEMSALQLDEGGAAAAPVGRGAMRGRREITPLLRTRPATVESKKGTNGTSVMLTSNYFKLLKHADWSLYHYRVDFNPEEDRNFIRKKLLRVHKDKFHGYVFDGTMMFTRTNLPDIMEVFSERESDQAKIRITIKKTNELSAGDPCYIQLFNILTRVCLEGMELQLVGREYFDPKAKASIHEFKMELWPGYSTSIRQHEDSILMNVEITHKVMRLETVADLINDCYSRDREYWQDLLLEAVVGLIVLTGFNNKTYRVDDVDFSSNPLCTFDMKGEKISYVDYYYKKYQIRIHNHNQPLLVSRTTSRERRSGMSETVNLIPELCRVTGITDEMRSNTHLMRALADHTKLNPAARIAKLHQFMNRLTKVQETLDYLKLWNLQLSTSLVEFSGRILQPETIFHGGGGRSESGPEADWTRNLRGKSMLLLPRFTNWAVICTNRVKRDVINFIQTLAKSASSLNITIPQPRIEETMDDRSTSYTDALEKLVSQYNPEIIMCIVPNNKADRYSAIKKKSLVDRCVPTQVVLAKQLYAKGVMSIATKIAIQMNCKIGGAPWTVDMPLKKTMVIGFDVSRDTHARESSFGAVVASLNKEMTQYYSAVSQHTNGEELSNQISNHIINACLKYKDYNNELPEKIIIYRDGVGEGQVHHVYTHEVELIRKNLSELMGQDPKMAFVIVTKRISTRLFYNKENPPPGTVADDVVTSPEKYDFFLVSQSVRQGTVSPTSYNVIYDTVYLPPCRMQRLTYKLCHLYFNWSGTVRVPAPCQYAHKLAFLVGQSVHKAPDKELCDKLYFL